jgi:subfamily B ATP-binding cassette protein MsbA
MQHHGPVGPKKPLRAANVYRDLRELVWPRRKLFGLGLLLIFINRAAALVLPGSTKFLIDDVIQKGRHELLVPLAAAVGGATLLQAITAFILGQVVSTSAQKMIVDLRIRLQQHIGRLPVRYYDANKAGVLVSRVMYDVDGHPESRRAPDLSTSSGA